MQELLISTDTSSTRVHIGKGQLQYLKTYINPKQYDSIFCIVDTAVYEMYGKIIEEGLSSPCNSYNVNIATFESNESNKTLSSIETLLDRVSDCVCTRSTLFIAIGGGIICDMTGLIAGLWYRGCDVMYVPTTLLSMVDASVGGKCGVDYKGHKNQLGLIIQPKEVVVDPLVLGTLEPKVFRDGCAEIIKHACLADPVLFEQLKKKPLTTSKHIDTTITYQLSNECLSIPSRSCSYTESELEDLIAQNIKIKASFVQADEHDRGMRAALNYGHTVAHALEAATNMQVTHGDAVAQGIVFANTYGEKEAISDPQFVVDTTKLLLAHGLLINEDKYDAYGKRHHNQNSNLIEDMKLHLSHDKKAKGDKVKFIFVEKPGIYHIKETEIGNLKENIDLLF